MAEALLIGKSDLQAYTSLNGNVDTDKLLQFIKVAQDVWVLQYLGTDLMNKIKTDIVASSLSGNYATLVNTYVKPMLVHFTMCEYLPFAAFTISNKGVFKHQAENTEGITKEDIDYLIEKEKRIAENYAQRLLDYLCINQSLFPEYNTNGAGDVFPQHGNNLTNWYI